MAVGYISAEETIRTATTDPYTFAATVPASCAGILLTSAHNVSATDHVPPANAVTIGGKAMGKLAAAIDSATEPGRAEMWFLGHDLPTAGAQTLSVDLTSATGDDFQFVLLYLSGATDLEPIAIAIDQADQANPSAVLAYGGRTAMSFGVLFSGLDAEASITAGANCSEVHEHDFGTQTASVIRQTNAGSTDFTIGWTAASDDAAAVYVAISEEQPSPVRDALLALPVAALWRMREPTGSLQLMDRSPNLRHATITGTPTFGVAGGHLTETSPLGIEFNPGASEYAEALDNAAFSIVTTGALTVGGWLKQSTGGAWLAKGALPASFEYHLYQGGFSGTVYDTDGALVAYAEEVTGWAGATWHMQAVTMDDTNNELFQYINGILDGTDTSWVGAVSDTTAPVRIGGESWGGPGSGNQILEDVFIIGSELLVGQIVALREASLAGRRATDSPYRQLLAQ